jgi:O-antigen ligase
MASIALLICTAFVLFLLRLERKQNPEASRALWIPTIWILLAISKPLGQWFRSGGSMETGSPLDRAVLTIILCLCVIILVKRRFDLVAAIRDNPWLIVLIVYMFVSILWSSMPGISFKRWIRELVAIAVAFLVYSERNPRLAVKSLLRRAIYILIPFSLLLIKFYPFLGRAYGRWSGQLMWIGISTQKNGLAAFCVMSAFFLLWVLWQRRKGSDAAVKKYQIYVELLLIVLSFYLMAGPQRSLTYSATALVGLAVGLLTFAGLLWATKNSKKVTGSALSKIVILIIIYGTMTPFIGKLSFWDVSTIVGRNESLTGRTQIWATLIPYAMKKPIIGHGVGGFWTTEMRALTSSHAHNGYLDVLLNFGFLGLGLISLYFLSCARKAAVTLAAEPEWGILFICFMMIALVRNITESSIETLTTGTTTLILCMSIIFPKIYSKQTSLQ